MISLDKMVKKMYALIPFQLPFFQAKKIKFKLNSICKSRESMTSKRYTQEGSFHFSNPKRLLQ
jgi:hypothetical protein